MQIFLGANLTKIGMFPLNVRGNVNSRNNLSLLGIYEGRDDAVVLRENLEHFAKFLD